MKLQQSSSPHIQEGTWEDFREDVKKVNPKLFSIIEQISPSKKYKLFMMEYLYGERITDMGTICLPIMADGQSIRLDDSRMPSKFKEALDYCPTPLILQIKNGSEVFVEASERIIPLNIFVPGDLYGLFESIMSFTNCPIAPCWSVTSGARSVFLGAKVTEAIGHKRLRADYGVQREPPTKLTEQWDIIKTIGNRSRANSPWTCKILVFPREWVENNDEDIGWLRFQKYLLVESWKQSSYVRKVELTIMWEAFASAVRDRNLKPGPYILDSMMHLIPMANQAIPGFKAADESELLLPNKAIEYAYENIYLLKEYASIVMHPYKLGANSDFAAIYYSLAYPTLLEGTPSIRHITSIISELREIRTLMMTLDRILQKQDERTHAIIKDAVFEYFHNEEDRFREISDSKDILASDPYLIECMKRFKSKKFPYQGPFFRGCIRITTKK